jgi:hypothetical protein
MKAEVGQPRNIESTSALLGGRRLHYRAGSPRSSMSGKHPEFHQNDALPHYRHGAGKIWLR